MRVSKRNKHENRPLESAQEDGLLVFKKSLITVVKEYLACSSLAGCSRIVEPGRHRIERWIWFIVICLAIYGAAYIGKLIWSDFVNKPTIVSLESNQYPIWKIPFPAVAICNVNILSRSKIEAFAESLPKYNNDTKGKIISELRLLGKNVDFSNDEYEDFIRLMGLTSNDDGFLQKLNSVDTKTVMKMFAPSCSSMLVLCRWANVDYNCSEIFETHLTPQGFCCTFNYNRKMSQSDKRVRKPKISRASMVASGLIVLLNSQIDDYFYMTHNSQGFDVYVFPTYEYPDPSTGNALKRTVRMGRQTFLGLSAKTTRNVPDIKHYSINQRKCMLPDDHPEKYHGEYSFNNCIFKCKVATFRALCKCVPFFLPAENLDVPYCGLGDVPCLSKYREKFKTVLTALWEPIHVNENSDFEPEDGFMCDDCFPDCAYTKYKTTVRSIPLAFTKSNPKFLKGLDIRNASLVFAYFEDIDTLLYKLDVVFHWFEIISNLGGICGLFIGLSLISVIEIVYFLTLRLAEVLYNNNFSLWKCC